MPSYNCGLYSSRAVAYSSRTQSQIDTFSVLHLLHDSLNVWTETIGFTTIRKIVDEHKLITAIYWVSYELEMRVSRLRRLTCTASTLLKRFLPIAWVDLKSEYTDFKMRFLKKKNCEALPRSQSLMLRWKILMCFLKFVARRVTKFFLMSVSISNSERTKLICLRECCELNAHLKYRFLEGFGSHPIPQSPVTFLSRMLSFLIFDQIFIHIHRSLSINDIKKLSNDLFSELFNLQTY